MPIVGKPTAGAVMTFFCTSISTAGVCPRTPSKVTVADGLSSSSVPSPVQPDSTTLKLLAPLRAGEALTTTGIEPRPFGGITTGEPVSATKSPFDAAAVPSTVVALQVTGALRIGETLTGTWMT